MTLILRQNSREVETVTAMLRYVLSVQNVKIWYEMITIYPWKSYSGVVFAWLSRMIKNTSTYGISRSYFPEKNINVILRIYPIHLHKNNLHQRRT